MLRTTLFAYLAMIALLALYLQLFPVQRPITPDPPPYGDMISYGPPGTNVPPVPAKSAYITKHGEFFVEVERVMQQLHSYPFTLRVAQSPAPPVHTPANPQNVTRGAIAVSATVEPVLTSDGNFTIVPLRTGAQVIEERAYLEWKWTVTPRETGEHPLHLLVKTPYQHPELGVVYRDALQQSFNIGVNPDIALSTFALVKDYGPPAAKTIGFVLFSLFVGVKCAPRLRRYPWVVATLKSYGIALVEPEKPLIIPGSSIGDRHRPDRKVE